MHTKNFILEVFKMIQCLLVLNSRQEMETHKLANHRSVRSDRGPQILGNQRLDILAKASKKCPICSCPVQSGKEFHYHVNAEHFDVISSQWKKCQKCSQFFPSGLILKKHLDTKCNNVFFSSFNDVTPVKGQTQCKFCPEILFSRKAYYTHVNSKHLDEISKRWFMCDVCSRYFPTSRLRYFHIYHHHKNNQVLGVTETNPSQSVSPSMSATNAAMNGSDGIVFNRPNDVTYKGRRSAQCNFCLAMFGSQMAWYAHVNSDHSAEASKHWIKCHACPKYYPNTVARDRHYYKPCSNRKIQDLASANPKHPSETISTSLQTTSLALTSSSYSFPLTHTRKCQFCNQFDYGRPTAYYFHVNKFHKDLAAQLWFQCDICSKFYPTKQVRNNHIYMKHTYRPVSSKTSDPQTSDKAEGDDETRPPQRLLPPATREVQKVVPLNSGGQQIASNTSLHEKKPTRENEQRIRQDSTVDFSEFTFISDSATSRSDQIVETGQPELTYRDKSVICHFCQICFEKSHDFYHHANLKHREAISKTWRLCQKCLWHFPTKKSLSNHGCDSPSTSTLEVPQRCQFCAFTFASLSSEYFQHANKAHLKIISKA